MFKAVVIGAKIFVALATLGFSTSSALANPPSSVMTFQTWKALRMEEARLVLDRLALENQVERTASIERAPGEKQAVVKMAAEPATRTAPPQRTLKPTSRAESRIEQAQINLEIAQELTVNDYMQIYLSRFRSREALLDVARRMGPDEVVDMLLSYQKLSMGAQVAEHMPPTPRSVTK